MLWDLTSGQSKWSVQAHNGHLGAIVTAPDGGSFLTVGNDKTIKRWSLEKTLEGTDLPVDTWMSDVSEGSEKCVHMVMFDYATVYFLYQLVCDELDN